MHGLITLNTLCSAGVDIGLMETRAGSVEFRHVLIQEAVVATGCRHLLLSVHLRSVDLSADDCRASRGARWGSNGSGQRHPSRGLR
jgi:hypothetical protein